MEDFVRAGYSVNSRWRQLFLQRIDLGLPASIALCIVCVIVAALARVLLGVLGPTLPFATFFPAVLISALFGGVLSADLAMNITPAFFLSALPAAVEVSNLTLAVGKSMVFGVLIALVGCHYGLRIEPNTESLGQGTTASVVTSITVVILVDALFAVVFKDVGI